RPAAARLAARRPRRPARAAGARRRAGDRAAVGGRAGRAPRAVHRGRPGHRGRVGPGRAAAAAGRVPAGHGGAPRHRRVGTPGGDGRALLRCGRPGRRAGARRRRRVRRAQPGVLPAGRPGPASPAVL
ncbi:MAG: hypothetical protein AVDCRST_MAG66-752, partial [uncultured Pseudonocardia sp.]